MLPWMKGFCRFMCSLGVGRSKFDPKGWRCDPGPYIAVRVCNVSPDRAPVSFEPHSEKATCLFSVRRWICVDEGLGRGPQRKLCWIEMQSSVNGQSRHCRGWAFGLLTQRMYVNDLQRTDPAFEVVSRNGRVACYSDAHCFEAFCTGMLLPPFVFRGCCSECVNGKKTLMQPRQCDTGHHIRTCAFRTRKKFTIYLLVGDGQDNRFSESGQSPLSTFGRPCARTINVSFCKIFLFRAAR